VPFYRTVGLACVSDSGWEAVRQRIDDSTTTSNSDKIRARRWLDTVHRRAHKPKSLPQAGGGDGGEAAVDDAAVAESSKSKAGPNKGAGERAQVRGATLTTCRCMCGSESLILSTPVAYACCGRTEHPTLLST
jgi:hypothetical protein